MKLQSGIIGLVVVSLGCGSGAQETPVPVFPVTGKVTYMGQPVVGADIIFHHESSDRSSFGRTDDQGEYQMTTFSANDGAVDGKHGVTIVKFEAPTEVAVVADTESDAYEPPGFNKSTDAVTPKTSLPEKFAQQATSGLIAVVNVDTPNKIDFDLKK